MFEIKSSLQASHDNTDKKAKKIIDSFLKKSARLYGDDITTQCYWPAEYYGLEKAEHYQNSSEETKRQILLYCQQDLLNESYFIEKMGITYSAKLVLLSPSTEVKQIFSFIGSDEATHLQWIMPFVPEKLRTQPTGPLLSIISEVVQLNNANLLYYLVQIILEGWGIKHYKNLSEFCLNPQLKTIFDLILQDEALHHHSGKSFFSSNNLTDIERKIIKDTLKAYCDLVRIGPQSIMLAVNKAMGGLSMKEYIQLYNSLCGNKNSQEKLNYLFKLMNQSGLEKIVQAISDEGYFTPYSPQHCAQVSHLLSLK